VPENGNCNVYRNVGNFLMIDAVHTRKPKVYFESQPPETKIKNYYFVVEYS
jgi:hypothetical protein